MSERALVAALAVASFSAIYSSGVIAPLVIPMAAEFGTTAGNIGIVAAAYALPGIVTGALTGPFSDRHGRRLFLVGGTSLIGAGTIFASFAHDLLTVTLFRGIAGVGAAVVLPNIMASIADRFGPASRPRVVSTVFIANSLGGIVGVTATGLFAQRYGWRAALALAGGVALIAAAASAVAPLKRIAASRSPVLGPIRRVATDRSALALLASNYFGAIAWQTWFLFIVVFFQRAYGLAQGAASTYALVQGTGLLIGTQLGPAIATRVGSRRSLAASLTAYGLVLVSVTTIQPPLPIAVAGSFLGAIFYGLRATSNAVLMIEQAPEARSTMFGLSATTVAAANATSATAGGIALDSLGFPAIGALCMTCAMLSAVIVVSTVLESNELASIPWSSAPTRPQTEGALELGDGARAVEIGAGPVDRAT